jgi:hypothetical protein
MTADSSHQAPPLSPTRHGYFVLQISTIREGEVAALSGVLEDLTTGGKLTFDSANGLARTLELWAEDAVPAKAPERMPPSSQTGAPT